MKHIKLIFFLLFSVQLGAQNLSPVIELKSKEILSKVIEWRRHLHQNPELSNREVKDEGKERVKVEGSGMKY